MTWSNLRYCVLHAPHFDLLTELDTGCFWIKLSQSFFKKILSTNSCLHTLLPPECNNEVLSKLRKPLKYPVTYSRTTDISPSSTTPWPTSKTTNESVCFILHFMLWTVYCIMCILYRVFYIVCFICLYCSYLYYRVFYQYYFLAPIIIINVPFKCLSLPCADC